MLATLTLSRTLVIAGAALVAGFSSSSFAAPQGRGNHGPGQRSTMQERQNIAQQHGVKARRADRAHRHVKAQQLLKLIDRNDDGVIGRAERRHAMKMFANRGFGGRAGGMAWTHPGSRPMHPGRAMVGPRGQRQNMDGALNGGEGRKAAPQRKGPRQQRGGKSSRI
jgi:hypothetical protein